MKWVVLVLAMLSPAIALAQQTTPRRLTDLVAAPGAAAASTVPVVEQTPSPAKPAPPARAADAGTRRRPSMVGYISDGTIGSRVRVRFDAGQQIAVPDRAEFFYAKCGCYRDLPASNAAFDPNAPGPGPGILTDLDFQQLHVQGEYAVVPDRVSLFVEVPLRWIRPQTFVPGAGSFPDHSGLADIRAGVKFAAVATPDQFVTLQLQFAAPTGESSKGLGVDHASVEPALLFYTSLAERVALEAQVGGVIPTGGAAGVPTTSAKKFAGNIFYYGIGPSFEVYSSDTVRLAPVIELVGWRVLSGFQTAAVSDASGTNIVNLKVGLRLVVRDRSSLYLGYGRALTDETWYDDIVRIEYRHSFGR